MKKFLSIVLVLVLSFSCFSMVSFAETNTTEHLTEVPEGYVGVYTVEDLYCVRNDLTANYILMNDETIPGFTTGIVDIIFRASSPRSTAPAILTASIATVSLSAICPIIRNPDKAPKLYRGLTASVRPYRHR